MLKGNANGVGYNLGVQLKATNKLQFGLTYRSQVNMKLKSGNATFAVPTSLESSFPNTNFMPRLELPALQTGELRSRLSVFSGLSMSPGSIVIQPVQRIGDGLVHTRYIHGNLKTLLSTCAYFHRELPLKSCSDIYFYTTSAENGLVTIGTELHNAFLYSLLPLP